MRYREISLKDIDDILNIISEKLKKIAILKFMEISNQDIEFNKVKSFLQDKKEDIINYLNIIKELNGLQRVEELLKEAEENEVMSDDESDYSFIKRFLKETNSKVCKSKFSPLKNKYFKYKNYLAQDNLENYFETKEKIGNFTYLKKIEELLKTAKEFGATEKDSNSETDIEFLTNMFNEIDKRKNNSSKEGDNGGNILSYTKELLEESMKLREWYLNLADKDKKLIQLFNDMYDYIIDCNRIDNNKKNRRDVADDKIVDDEDYEEIKSVLILLFYYYRRFILN